MNKSYTKQSNHSWLFLDIFQRPLFILFVTGVLTACGGGGGTETSAPLAPVTPDAPKPIASLSIVVEEQAVSVEENAQVTIPVNVTYTGSKALSVTMNQVVIAGLSIAQSENDDDFVITISAGELMGKIEEVGDLSINVTDGVLSESANVSVTTSNTSFLQLIDLTAQKFDALDALDVSDELSSITSFVADKAYLYGVMTHDEKTDWADSMSSLVSDIQSTVTAETRGLLADVLNQRADITENQAIDLIAQAKEVLAASGAEFDQLSAEIDALSVPNLTPLASFIITDYQGKYSLFYGNAAYGAESNEAWVFMEKWAVLSKLLPFTSQSCPVTTA